MDRFGKPSAQYKINTQLQCGVCASQGVETIIKTTLALDRMYAMLNHWHHNHDAYPVPVFDMDTWRTGVVYPLGSEQTQPTKEEQPLTTCVHTFMSKCGVCGVEIGGDGDVCNLCAQRKS